MNFEAPETQSNILNILAWILFISVIFIRYFDFSFSLVPKATFLNDLFYFSFLVVLVTITARFQCIASWDTVLILTVYSTADISENTPTTALADIDMYL